MHTWFVALKIEPKMGSSLPDTWIDDALDKLLAVGNDTGKEYGGEEYAVLIQRIDDIEDNSKLRRGVPVAHAIFGMASTINTANYVYFQALERTQRLENSRAVECFTYELLNLHRGQGRDIAWRELNHCPTEDEYKSMALDKTGGLLRLAVGLMQAFSKDERCYTTLVNSMALYFQIRDDLINLASPEYMKGKSFCEDLTEGKFSFPIIHCIRSDPDDHRLLNILRQRTEDVDIKTHAVMWMQRTGSLVYTRERLLELKASMATEIASLGGHLGLSRVIEGLDRQLENLELGTSSPVANGDTRGRVPRSSSTLDSF